MLEYHKGDKLMLQTIEGVIGQNGILHVLEPIQWPKQRRVLIPILNEEPADDFDAGRCRG
jgi:hypothetical protein